MPKKKITINKVIDFVKGLGVQSILVIIIVFLLSFLIMIIFPSTKTIIDTANLAASSAGKVAGLAKGSAIALFDSKEVIDKAKEEASEGEVTKIDIRKQFDETGKIEVLSCDVSLARTHEVGNPVKFAQLLYREGECYFVLDLKELNIEEKDDVIIVTLNAPTVEIRFKGFEEELTHYSVPQFIDISTEDKAKGRLNQAIKDINELKEKLSTCESLVDLAKKSGEATISSIIKSVSDKKVKVIYEGEVSVNER